MSLEMLFQAHFSIHNQPLNLTEPFDIKPL